jgi:hypothetical protein
MMTPQPVQSPIASAIGAGNSWIPTNYLHNMGQVESSGNPILWDKGNSNRGLYQFGPDEERMYGISNWRDPNQQNNAAIQEANKFRQPLASVLGRDPTGAELYLAHQQNLPEAKALLGNPNMPAWQAIRPYYKSDSMAQNAIRGNLPTAMRPGANSMSASDFTNYLRAPRKIATSANLCESDL